MNGMEGEYIPPLSLTIIGAIFLLVAAFSAVLIAVDIVLRKGWRTMMGIMIPTYIITALYLGPAGIWLYWRYGRPKWALKIDHQPEDGKKENHVRSHEHHDPIITEQLMGNSKLDSKLETIDDQMHQPPPNHRHHHHIQQNTSHSHPMNREMAPEEKLPSSAEAHMHPTKPIPFYVSVLIGVTHCGAGCVLGDIIGEWLIYGTNISISARSLYPEFLIDYGFALLFGIAFQYFSIAPMANDWGVRSVVRAAKADVLSLTAFEIGLFGWMAAYQVGIWGWRLGMVSSVYWWMMQIGMGVGFLTSFPMNWYLVKWGIKEPHVM